MPEFKIEGVVCKEDIVELAIKDSQREVILSIPNGRRIFYYLYDELIGRTIRRIPGPIYGRGIFMDFEIEMGNDIYIRFWCATKVHPVVKLVAASVQESDAPGWGEIWMEVEDISTAIHRNHYHFKAKLHNSELSLKAKQLNFEMHLLLGSDDNGNKVLRGENDLFLEVTEREVPND